MVVRDEADRLPFALDHHRRLGVSTFVVIDNGSSDGTTQLLRDRDDVWLWSTDGSYLDACAGYAWAWVVLRQLACPGWWLFLDADEVFTYLPGDDLWLPDLCRALDDEGTGALPAILLDCYPTGAVSSAVCPPGCDPRTICPWFDGNWATRVDSGAPPRHWGGARHRMFPIDEGYLITKVPLVRWAPGVVVGPGAHFVAGAVPSTSRRAALLHFKFLAGFAGRARLEVAAPRRARRRVPVSGIQRRVPR